MSIDAADITIADSGDYYDGTNLEDVLSELASQVGLGSVYKNKYVFSGRTDGQLYSGFAGTTSITSAYPYGTRYNANQNDYMIFKPVHMRAGTYELTLVTYTYSGGGIITFSLYSGDDPTQRTLTEAPHNASGATGDGYTAGSVVNTIRTVCSDLILPSDDTYTLRADVLSKNASSSNYATNINAVILERVSD